MSYRPISNRYMALHQTTYEVGLSGLQPHIMVMRKMRSKDVNV